jgi:hypothetical protein
MRKTALSWPMIAVSLSVTGSAAADENPTGRYAIVGVRFCLWAPSGFATNSNGDPTYPNENNSYQGMNNIQGVQVFNGDGTGKTTGTYVGMTPPPPDSRSSPKASVGAGTFSYEFTHTPVSNNSFTITSKAGTIQGTITHGPGVGQSYSIDKNEYVAVISNDQKQITYASVTPYVENLTLSGSPPRTVGRSCFGSISGFRLD